MIRVAICSEDEQTRLMLRAMTDRLGDRLGVPCLETKQLASLAALEDHLKAVRSGLVDIVVLHLPDGIPEGTDVADVAAEIGEDRLVIVSPNRLDAAAAYSLRASFLLDPIDPVYFVRVMRRMFDLVKEKHKKRVVVKSKNGIDSLSYDNILFVETGRNGVVVHLADEQTVALRSSLQALFDGIKSDPRFVKAGSSFVLNLDNVRSFGAGSVIFSGGEAIIIPVRSRRPIRDAFDAYQTIVLDEGAFLPNSSK